jgi:hypothetical protein
MTKKEFRATVTKAFNKYEKMSMVNLAVEVVRLNRLRQEGVSDDELLVAMLEMAVITQIIGSEDERV